MHHHYIQEAVKVEALLCENSILIFSITMLNYFDARGLASPSGQRGESKLLRNYV